MTILQNNNLKKVNKNLSAPAQAPEIAEVEKEIEKRAGPWRYNELLYESYEQATMQKKFLV